MYISRASLLFAVFDYCIFGLLEVDSARIQQLILKDTVRGQEERS
jgi:hypothetical protein